eukprot:sb/3463097/
MSLNRDPVTANSYVLSFNSPLFADLIGKLKMKEIELFEFSSLGVTSFVECCHKGSVDGILSETNFREVTKLGSVFKVVWMHERCLTFYSHWCGSLKSFSTNQALQLFEEGAYFLKETSNRKFLKALNDGLKPHPCLRLAIIRNFMVNELNIRHFRYSDACLAISGPQIHYLYEELMNVIKGRPAPKFLTENEKRLLNIRGLSACKKFNIKIFNKLRKCLLSSLSGEELRFVFEKLTDSIEYIEEDEVEERNEEREIENEAIINECFIFENNANVVECPVELPALNNCTTIKDAIEVLDAEPRIATICQLFDGILYFKKLKGLPRLSKLFVPNERTMHAFLSAFKNREIAPSGHEAHELFSPFIPQVNMFLRDIFLSVFSCFFILMFFAECCSFPLTLMFLFLTAVLIGLHGIDSAKSFYESFVSNGSFYGVGCYSRLIINYICARNQAWGFSHYRSFETFRRCVLDIKEPLKKTLPYSQSTNTDLRLCRLTLGNVKYLNCPDHSSDTGRCGIAVNVTIEVVDWKAWPKVKLKLCDDPEFFSERPTVHFHQQESYLKNMRVFVNDFNIHVCANKSEFPFDLSDRPISVDLTWPADGIILKEVKERLEQPQYFVT